MVFCENLLFPAPSKFLNFKEKGRICESQHFGVGLSPYVRPPKARPECQGFFSLSNSQHLEIANGRGFKEGGFRKTLRAEIHTLVI